MSTYKTSEGMPADKLISDFVAQERPVRKPLTSAARTARRTPRRQLPQNGYYSYMLPHDHAVTAVKRRAVSSAPTLDDLLRDYAVRKAAHLEPSYEMTAVANKPALPHTLKTWLSNVGQSAATTYVVMQSKLMGNVPMRYSLYRGISINWRALPRKRAAALLLVSGVTLSVLATGPATNQVSPLNPAPTMPGILSGRQSGSTSSDTGFDGSDSTFAGKSGWTWPANTRAGWTESTPKPTYVAGTPGVTPQSTGTAKQPVVVQTPAVTPSTPVTPVIPSPAPAPNPAPVLTVPAVTTPVTSDAGVSTPGVSLGLGL